MPPVASALLLLAAVAVVRGEPEWLVADDSQRVEDLVAQRCVIASRASPLLAGLREAVAALPAEV